MAEGDPNTGGTPPAWYSTLDQEHVGHIQTLGWDKLDPAAAALEAIKAHRSANKMLGVPPEQLLRLPKAEDTDAWGPVWQRLGAPEKPDGYDFSALAFDDEPTTTAIHNALREGAASMHMPKAMAEGLAKVFHKFVEDHGAAMAAETEAAQAEAMKQLTTEWGPEGSPRFQGNEQVANAARQRMGVTDEQYVKLQEALGRADALRFFQKLGAGLGEDKFVRDPGPGGRDVMTREQAMARRNELLGDGRPGSGDQAFIKRYMEGETAARREIQAILNILAGAQ